MLIWINVTKLQYVSASVISWWQLPGHYSSAVSVGSICTMCTYLSRLSSRQTTRKLGPCSTVMTLRTCTTSMYRNTWSISGHTRISGTCVQQTQGKWYIDTWIQLFLELSWSMWARSGSPNKFWTLCGCNWYMPTNYAHTHIYNTNDLEKIQKQSQLGKTSCEYEVWEYHSYN